MEFLGCNAEAVKHRHGEVLTSQFTRARIDAQDTWDLLGCTKVHHDETFWAARTSYHDETFDGAEGLRRMSARLVVKARDGAVLTHEVDGPTGGRGRPLSNEQIRAKCRLLLRDVIDPAAWSHIESLVLGLEQSDDVSELLAAMCQPVDSPDHALDAS